MTNVGARNVELESEFFSIRFILTAGTKQCNYLIKNLTESQTKSLCEVTFNLLNFELPYPVKKIFINIQLFLRSSP